MNKRGFSGVAVVIIILLVLIVSGGIWYYETHENSPVSQSIVQTGNSVPGLSEQNMPNESTSTIIIPTTSTLVVVNGDPYGLFMIPANLVQNYDNFEFEENYINDGVIATGPYQGYNRLVVYLSESFDQSDLNQARFLLATKNYQSFVLDDSIDFDHGSSSQEAVNYLSEDMGMYFNTAKISGQGSIPLSFPLSITNGSISYSSEGYYYSTSSIPTEDTTLPTLVPGLHFFADSPNYHNVIYSQYSQNVKNYLETFNNYIVGPGDFIAEDNTGVNTDYSINYPDLEIGGTGFPAVASGTVLYNSYGSRECNEAEYNDWYALKNISDSDLVKIGTNSSGTVFYSLKNSNHPLNQAIYYSEISSEPNFSRGNNGISIPSFNDFVAKYPILIIKDPFGRLLGIDEVQYNYTQGWGLNGCP